MVPPSEVLAFVRAEPFRPFQIRMASGQTYEIRHPELINVRRNVLFVYSSGTGSVEAIDRSETVSLMLIESIRPAEPPAA